MASNYLSIANAAREVVGGELTDSGYTTGTSSTGTDLIELRVLTGAGVTRRDICVALKAFERYVLNGGKLGDGANLPSV